jgi:hypothetical protein
MRIYVFEVLTFASSGKRALQRESRNPWSKI